MRDIYSGLLLSYMRLEEVSIMLFLFVYVGFTFIHIPMYTYNDKSV